MIPKELTFLVFLCLFFCHWKKSGAPCPPYFQMIPIELISLIFFIRKSGTSQVKIYWGGRVLLPGGGPQIRTPQDPPPGKVKNSGGVWTPPPGKSKNSGGVRAKKARCSLAMESTKKLAKILTGLFSSKTTQNLRRNYTSFELAAL